MAGRPRGQGADPLGLPDWSHCPLGCHCTWVGGKRSADCQDPGGYSSLPVFPYADQIQVLHLAGNPIMKLPETVFNRSDLINLQKVYLQNCSLSVVHPTAFINLVLMIELDLSNNNIRVLLPGTFSGNIRIRKLWLHHNPLRTLHDFSFPVLSHLRTLDLSHCLLRRIGQDTFQHIGLVEVLSLAENQLHRLDPAAFRSLANIKSLLLSHNPWHCNCRLEAAWHWVITNNLFNNPTVCVSPSKLAGRSWDSLEQPDLACPPRVNVTEPGRSVALGSSVALACSVRGVHSRVNWVRSGFIVKNNSLSLDGGTQSYVLRWVKVTNRRAWYNLTIKHVDRSGSGMYSCVAESEGGMAEQNATIVITDSSTYLGKKELSMVWVGVASFFGVFLVLFGAMTYYAVREKHRRRHSLLAPHPEVGVKPAESAVIFSRALAAGRVSAQGGKGEYDSPVGREILERERDHCNSSNSNNSGYSGDDSGVGSSSSNIVRLEPPFLRPAYSSAAPSRLQFPDLVTLPISEEDPPGEERGGGTVYPESSYLKPHFADWPTAESGGAGECSPQQWPASDSTTCLMRGEETAEPREQCSLPRHLPSWPLPAQPLGPLECSLPRGPPWRGQPSSLTDSDFSLLKEELEARRTRGGRAPPARQAFMLTRAARQTRDARSQLLHALVQDHSDTVV